MTEKILEPITTESLKQVFVAKFEELILSGKISIGEMLPSERELAAQLKISRPVVHEGLIELSLWGDRKSTRLNSSHIPLSRMPSSA